MLRVCQKLTRTAGVGPSTLWHTFGVDLVSADMPVYTLAFKVRLAKRFGDAAMSGVDNANEESVTHAPRQALHE